MIPFLSLVNLGYEKRNRIFFKMGLFQISVMSVNYVLGSLNCAAYMAGMIEAILCGGGFVSSISVLCMNEAQ